MKKKTRLLILLALAVMLLAALAVSASAATEGYYTYSVSGGEATITDCNTAIRGAVTIPSTLGGYPVTSIGDYAFSHCTSLKSVTIPDSVTTIGSSAFNDTGYYNNSSNWENGVLYIGKYLIKAKNTLSGNYTIKDGTRCIADSAFCDCSALTSVTIPNSVTSIGDDAFEGCISLTNVTIGDSVTSIGYCAFNNTGYYNNSSNWENGVLYIGKYLIRAETESGYYYSVRIKDGTLCIVDDAFFYCTALTSVTIPDSVTSIGNYAFWDCTSLTSVTIGNSVTSIGYEAFRDCTALTSVTIGNGVTSIGYEAFWDCTSLTSISVAQNNTAYASEDGILYNKDKTELICYPESKTETAFTIPDSVTSIGNRAFSGCTALTSVTIPDSVTGIGDYAFSRCDSLTSVYYTGTPTQRSAMNINSYYNSNLTNAVWHCGYETATTGKCGDNLTYTYNTATKTLTISGSGAMWDYSYDLHPGWYAYKDELTSVTIGDSVTSIGYRAFYDCTSLTSVTIPDSVTIIGSNAFSNTGYYNNSGNWENGVLYIGKYLIQAKDALSGSYTVKDGTRCIADSAFQYCTSLTSVTIGNSVTSIGDGAFENCSRLRNITIPNGVKTIGNEAFACCSAFTSVMIPDSVTSIGSYAFSGCAAVSKITIGSGVTSIGSGAFDGTNYYKKSSNWEDDVLYIGSYLIAADAEMLAGDYTVKDGTLCIADCAFCYCTSLTSVTMPTGLKSIGAGAFVCCPALSSVTIPSSVTSIGDGAFSDCAVFSDMYYTGTEAQWNAIGIGEFNEALTTAAKHFDQTPAAPALPYTITSLTVCDASGKTLSAIPKNDFLASVAIRRMGTDANAWVYLAAYTQAGQMKKCVYVRFKDLPLSTTAEAMLPIANDGTVACVKAFVLSGIGNWTPLSEIQVIE